MSQHQVLWLKELSSNIIDLGLIDGKASRNYFSGGFLFAQCYFMNLNFNLQKSE
ncbi:hypothetical protein LV89_03336 [Arcicella aurantiaca]|uniref:Uncharacterized protein n=1 Tax=Arcicella aurantiaca TaxID=591202 RepID=A0A316DX58_9BACT|nr:hypothetical protein LV89_03336 [Arcicella aurantiaca]